jgi:arsenite methyltransferase
MEKQLHQIGMSEEDAVHMRYSDAAQAVEPALCCPVEYSAGLLEVIPQEVLERDYGCGDPTPFVRSGETVLDLGSGGGKLCFIAAQLVGKSGRVIGVDCNTKMMELAKQAAPQVAAKIGYANVEFRFGLIQDLGLDLALLERELSQRPVQAAADYLQLRQLEERLRRDHPLVADESVDCVLSNCVLNLVRTRDRKELFREIFRVLKPGGRAAISDIVADESVPQHLKDNPELWSGCISGAFREDEFMQAFEEAGFHGLHIAKREQEPWRTVEGIEFRSVTVVATKGEPGPCLDQHQALIYRGPFKQVQDDAGQVFYRGERMAVCGKTFELLQKAPYEDMFWMVEPKTPISAAEAKPFDCEATTRRSPRETKGPGFQATISAPVSCCGDGNCC